MATAWDGRSLADGVDVPAAVRAAIAGELDGLSAPARRFAEAAAVAGDPFDVDLAVATGGATSPKRCRRSTS